MTLLGLFEKMKEKGYHYFEGKTNSRDESIYVEFSTLHSGRGDSVELAVNYPTETYDVTIRKGGKTTMIDDIDCIRLFELINELA